MRCWPWKTSIESSSGAISEAYPDTHFDNALNPPMNERILLHVGPDVAARSGEILYGHGNKVPLCHIYPNIVVRIEQMKDGDCWTAFITYVVSVLEQLIYCFPKDIAMIYCLEAFLEKITKYKWSQFLEVLRWTWNPYCHS